MVLNTEPSAHVADTKTETVEENMEILLDENVSTKEETLALGDSESDFYMADHVGMFCLVENGLTSAGAPEFLDACDNAYVTRGKIVDGWVATAELLVAARS